MNFVALVFTPRSDNVEAFGLFRSRALAKEFCDQLAACDYQKGDHVYRVFRLAAPEEVLPKSVSVDEHKN